MQNSFITVPATTLPNGVLVPAFKVGQFLTIRDESGKAAVTAEGKPWTDIDHADTRNACAASDLALITELQWLAIAHDVAAQACNWTSGIVGEGKLFQGLRKGTVSSAKPGTYEPADPDEQRWLTLSNGERICDFAGNAFSWVFDNVQGDESGLIAKPFAADSASLAAPYPSMENGMGWRPTPGADWSGGALIRGGCWYSGSDAGAFYLLFVWPDYARDDVGFRCTHPGL